MDIYKAVKGWERKAVSWDAPKAKLVDPAAREAIEALPVIRISTIFPCQNFGIDVPQYFVALRPNGERFLVDTEGATYARYIVRLIDAEGK